MVNPVNTDTLGRPYGPQKTGSNNGVTGEISGNLGRGYFKCTTKAIERALKAA